MNFVELNYSFPSATLHLVITFTNCTVTWSPGRSSQLSSEFYCSVSLEKLGARSTQEDTLIIYSFTH